MKSVLIEIWLQGLQKFYTLFVNIGFIEIIKSYKSYNFFKLVYSIYKIVNLVTHSR